MLDQQVYSITFEVSLQKIWAYLPVYPYQNILLSYIGISPKNWALVMLWLKMI